MKKILLYPVFDFKALDMFKVLAVVSHNNKSLSFCCTANKQIEVVDLLPRLPEPCSLQAKRMNGFVGMSLLFLLRECLQRYPQQNDYLAMFQQNGWPIPSYGEWDAHYYSSTNC